MLILMHEFTHSITAWLLGCKENPLGIVWGNPIMMTGWDEGVHYSKVFQIKGNIKETIIGAMPLLMHGVMVTFGLVVLRKRDMLKHKWLFHLIYWFIIANLMELIAYIVMRPFAPNGDTGHFNRGLNISPWYLFIIGTVLLVYVIYIIFSKVIPDLCKLFAASNILIEWSILVLSTFIVFLWGSGLRILFYVYPDPQWKFGIIGIIAFLIIPIVYRPAKRCSDI